MLSFLEIHQFRNIAFSKIEPSLVNLFYGRNGSGKTSILEAVYYLSLGRSFRTRHVERIIQHDQPFLSLFSKIDEIHIGLRRNLTGDFNIRIDGENIYSISQLTSYIPVQLINHDSFSLLTSGPSGRRQFIDWGTFHVKRDLFFTPWKKLSRVIKQRNAAIKTKSTKQITAWDKELIHLSCVVNQAREDYLKEWFDVIDFLLKQTQLDFDIKFNFYSGWNTELSLEEVVQQSLNKDILFGYTQYGAHRADLKITINKKPVLDVMSRGQQKMLIILMKIAQTRLLKEKQKKNAIFLIDDLPSELDEKYRQIISNLLIHDGNQLFITGIEKRALDSLYPKDNKQLFHIENGKIFIV